MRRLFFLGAVLVAAASGCGGGGGGSSAPPGPVPTATAPTQALPAGGGTVPANGIPTSVGNYQVLITLSAIAAGSPASGSVFYSTSNSFAGLAGAPPNAPTYNGGTPLLYTDIRVSAASGSSVTFDSQPTFDFTLPAGSSAGPYYLAFSDPTAASASYTTIAGPATANGTSLTLAPLAGIPVTLMLNQNYTYVLFR